MPPHPNKTFYERHLPHYQPEDCVYAVLFRLHGSIPAVLLSGLREERVKYLKYVSGARDASRRRELLHEHARREFERLDSFLHDQNRGPHWLRNDRVAEIVSDALHHWDGIAYELLAHSIMPNHVHVVLSTGSASAVPLVQSPFSGQTPYSLTNILASIKKFSAIRANRILGRSGRFWQEESYDHVVRDLDELEASIWYVLNNPVKAGLVDEWTEWPWNYLKAGLI